VQSGRNVPMLGTWHRQHNLVKRPYFYQTTRRHNLQAAFFFFFFSPLTLALASSPTMRVLYRVMLLFSYQGKQIAVNTTSKCYIFNLATCFDIRGSSSGTLFFFFLLVDSTSLTSDNNFYVCRPWRCLTTGHASGGIRTRSPSKRRIPITARSKP